MNDRILVTVLVENSAQGRGLMGEHGLAFHIQTGSESLLFDTGQSTLVVDNARHLGVDLSPLRAVALSHGHYDHTGGLPAVLALAPQARVYAHSAALTPRFARDSDGTTRAIGMSAPVLEAIRALSPPMQGTPTATELSQGIFLTGEIPRETAFEDVGGPFVLDAAGVQPDPIVDDQALFFDTREGLVVVLGCAHAGVVNTLHHVRRLTGNRPIHAVLGGMHLLNASPDRLNRTVDALRELGVRLLGPAHCTGAAATARLWHEFPKACTTCSVGSSFVFQRQEGDASEDRPQARPPLSDHGPSDPQRQPDLRTQPGCDPEETGPVAQAPPRAPKATPESHPATASAPQVRRPISRWDRVLARVCQNCPVCRRARQKPGSPAFQLVSKVERHLCPFCRAYERVHGRPAHGGQWKGGEKPAPA